MRKSKFYSRLKSMGFSPASDDLQRSTSERKRMMKEGFAASFTKGQVAGRQITIASDETHLLWEAQGHIDLAHLGFQDTTKQAGEVLEKLFD